MNIAVVIPVYLDADALPELLDRLFLTCARQGYDAEVILVDDGSGNDTWQRLIDLRHANPSRRIVLLRLAENRGQQAATICGLVHCCAEIAITMDSDLQHPPEEIPVLLQALTARHLDLAYGIPAQRRHSLPRRAGGLAFRALAQPVGSAVTGSSFRAIRMALTAGLREATRTPYLSLDSFIRTRTGRIASLKVDHAARRHGTSTYTWRKLLVTALKELHYSGRSAAIYLMLGVLAAAAGGLDLLRKATGPMTADAAASRTDIFLLTIGFILFLSGLHRLGAAGQSSRRPLFVLAEKIE